MCEFGIFVTLAFLTPFLRFFSYFRFNGKCVWPSYLHGFLANIVVFAYIPLFCKKCPPTQSALSAENLNILVTELRIRGYPKDFQNLGVGFRGVGPSIGA